MSVSQIPQQEYPDIVGARPDHPEELEKLVHVVCSTHDRGARDDDATRR